jgi:hypothetical protein
MKTIRAISVLDLSKGDRSTFPSMNVYDTVQ